MPLRIGSDTTNTPLPGDRRDLPEPDPNPTRTCLGRYEILDVLGSGSMGAVFQARDPQLARLVAVKTIRLAPCAAEDEQEFRTRLVREAEAAARLAHPGIVTIFDLGHDENNEPYFVMEYVAGQGLDKLIKSRALSLEAAIDIALQLARALDYAHRQGIVHRDIKPANIIVTEDGRAKITDFGIAKLDISQITMPGLMLGTPAYMAPEQLIGGAVDGRADLFSLGVTLYMMATGQRPFQANGDDPDTVLLRMLNPDPVPLSEIDPRLPNGLAHIIRRSLQKKPSDRYQTGMEMALDLEDLQAGRLPRSYNPSDESKIAMPPGVTLKPSSKKPASRKVAPFRVRFPQLRLKRALRSANTSATLAVIVVLIATVVVFRAVRQLHNANIAAAVSRPTMPAPAVAKTPSIAPVPTTTEPKVLPKPASSPPKKQPAQLQVRAAVEKNAIPKKPNVVPFSPLINPATLHVTIQHPFKSGNVAVWSDGQLLYVRELTSIRSKRLVVLNHSAGYEAADLRVPAGQHVIRVRVTSDGFEASNSIQSTFEDAQETSLHVIARKGEGLQLTLE